MFISFEGLDGSGKTTQFELCVAQLLAQGYPVLATREPGGTVIGDQIREILLSRKYSEMQPRTELLLFVASRAQLVEQVIRPHLAKGGIVISDRFADSTLAYQGHGHGLDLTILRQIIHFATAGVQPDLTIYLDISTDQAIQRRHQSVEGIDRLDNQKLGFYDRVYKGYQALIQAEPKRWKIVDATGNIETVQQRIQAALAPHLIR